MKLIEAASFAVQHFLFQDYLKKNNIPADTAWSVSITFIKRESGYVFFELRADFGERGESKYDVRVFLRYMEKTGSFVFDQIGAHR